MSESIATLVSARPCQKICFVLNVMAKERKLFWPCQVFCARPVCLDVEGVVIDAHVSSGPLLCVPTVMLLMLMITVVFFVRSVP